ncbi:MAG: hypothetical protein K5Q68_03480 [Roseococcus sp.]|nr:hypothetical protein [Roseococcus sp.]
MIPRLSPRVLALAAAMMATMPAAAQSQSLCSAHVPQSTDLNLSLDLIAVDLTYCRRGDHLRINTVGAEITALVAHFCDFEKAIITNQAPGVRSPSGAPQMASFVACIYVGRRVPLRRAE